MKEVMFIQSVDTALHSSEIRKNTFDHSNTKAKEAYPDLLEP